MALSLRQARLCLDCDCLTDDLSCPWCDRDGTVPISGWFRPLDDDPSNAPRHGKAVAPPARRWVLIVQSQQRDLYRVLREALVAAAVEVLYERRVGPAGARSLRRPRGSGAAPIAVGRGRPRSSTRARSPRRRARPPRARAPAGRRGRERRGPAVASPPRSEARTGRGHHLDVARGPPARARAIHGRIASLALFTEQSALTPPAGIRYTRPHHARPSPHRTVPSRPAREVAS